MLRDPARRRIIKILGNQGKIGFKELKHELGLGVGTVYYHLDMLSDFLTQDKHRKYMLNDRGRLLHKLLKEGSLPPGLEIGEAFSHRLGGWLFLSHVFAKTVRLWIFLPVAVAVLVLGAFGSALARLEPVFFFYFSSNRSFEGMVLISLFYWIGLFLLADATIYVLFRRRGGDLQLFACLGLSALPLALFPYVYMMIPAEVSWISRYVLLVLQVWTLLLVSSAFSFGEGLRLDRSIVVSLIVLYLNIALLMLQGRLS
ncbi:MAG: hypothetical protein AOA66_0720 [Candidatus Bathyarchaeota archaeon BA2]|nr:MAG: hypothetical protein AOA66_0720 [Candidatus Bathyarchaeota archaeon BA2]